MKRLSKSFSIAVALLGTAAVIGTYWATEGNADLAKWVGGMFLVILTGKKGRDVLQANKDTYFDEEAGVPRKVQ